LKVGVPEQVALLGPDRVKMNRPGGIIGARKLRRRPKAAVSEKVPPLCTATSVTGLGEETAAAVPDETTAVAADDRKCKGFS
jgi:hypothetical protein